MWYEIDVTGGQPNFMLSDSLQLVITTWQIYKLDVGVTTPHNVGSQNYVRNRSSKTTKTLRHFFIT
jgi:hypothetical protein